MKSIKPLYESSITLFYIMVLVAFSNSCKNSNYSEDIYGRWSFTPTVVCDDPIEQAKINDSEIMNITCEFKEGNKYSVSSSTKATQNGYYRIKEDSLIINESEGKKIGYKIISFNKGKEFICESKIKTGKNEICKITSHFIKISDSVNEANETHEGQPARSKSDGTIDPSELPQAVASGSEGDPGFKFEFEPDATGIVKVSDFLSLKESPNINSKIIIKIMNGSVVKMLEETSECETIENEYNCWYRVSYKNIEGYVFGKYLDIQY